MAQRRKTTYRDWDADQYGLLAVSPREALPADDLVFFLLDVIATLDLEPFHRHYAAQMRGQPPFDVTMMVTLLVYGYCVGVCSSRKIATACERNLAFRQLNAQIEQLLAQAEQIDAEQDAALGSRRGDEMPAELKRREDHLAKILEAKARLEKEAQTKADEEQKRRDEEQAKREAEGRKRRGKEPAPVDPTPEDKAQTNFTDPQAKIMKQPNKGFSYSYNAQAVVDATAQIIVAAEVTNQANDKQQGVPMA